MSQNVTAANPAAMERVKFKKQSQAKEIWRRFRKNRGSMVGLIMLTIIVLALVFANLITSYDAATAQNLRIKLDPPLCRTLVWHRLLWQRSLCQSALWRQNLLVHRRVGYAVLLCGGLCLGCHRRIFRWKGGQYHHARFGYFHVRAGYPFHDGCGFRFGSQHGQLAYRTHFSLFHQLCPFGSITDPESFGFGICGGSTGGRRRQRQDHHVSYFSKCDGRDHCEHDPQRSQNHPL